MRSLEQRFAESKAVILDVDCVLVRSHMSIVAQSVQLVQLMRGHIINPLDVMDIQSNNVKTDDILEALVQPTDEEWPKVRRLHKFLFGINSYMPPIGKPAAFAQDVRASNRKTALWTSRQPEFLTAANCPSFVFADDDPFRLFDAVSTYQGGATDKPHPQSLRRLAAQLEIPEDDYGKIVVVEDMPQNIEVARELGMLTVGVLTGLAGPKVSQDRLEKVTPDLILSDYEALRPYLGLPLE
jgi:HAD superfamily hydrolase (TIGR01509 family)